MNINEEDKTGIPSEIGILFQIVWLFNIVSSIRRRQIHGRLKKQTYKGARHSREKRTRNIKKYQKSLLIWVSPSNIPNRSADLPPSVYMKYGRNK